MSKLTVNMNLTLDGVMQAPGRPDEDTRGGFEYGGWAAPYFDPTMGSKVAAESKANPGVMLFGRRTYEDFYEVWPKRTESPFSEVLNNLQKYVASTTLSEPLPWVNSTLLAGDAGTTVAALKETLDRDIVVLGSGNLIQTLMQHNLVDEYVLSIHPLVFGTGRRLFPEGSPYSTLQLIETRTSSTGVIIATYQPAESTAGKTT